MPTMLQSVISAWGSNVPTYNSDQCTIMKYDDKKQTNIANTIIHKEAKKKINLYIDQSKMSNNYQ